MDFNPGDSTVEIPTEEGSSTIVFTIPKNEIVEDHETFTVSLSAVIEPGSLIRTDTPITIHAPSADTDVGIIDDDTGK